MRNDSTAIQVLAFISLLFFILFVYKYYVNSYERPVLHNVISTNTNQITPYHKDKDIRVRCPPEELIKKAPIQQEDLKHKNDIDNAYEKINLYEDQNIDTYGFENELGNNKYISKAFDEELEEVYQVEELPKFMEKKQCSIKPHKSDLPIINVPLYLLEKDKPLRLSERPL
jgi:hypothetical protein